MLSEYEVPTPTLISGHITARLSKLNSPAVLSIIDCIIILQQKERAFCRLELLNILAIKCRRISLQNHTICAANNTRSATHPYWNRKRKKQPRPAGELMKSPQTREGLCSDDLFEKSLFFIDFGFLSSILWFDLPLLFQHPLVDLALLILGQWWEYSFGWRSRLCRLSNCSRWG